MSQVILPEVLCRVGGFPSEPHSVKGYTVGEQLDDLCDQLPGLRAQLFHDSGQLKDHFVVTVGGSIATVKSAVPSEHTLELLLASSGGSAATTAESTADLSQSEVQRYARHLTLPRVGRQGQQTLKDSRVLLVGAGGLGCPVGLYLSAAGVGTIGIIDNDVVELSNLQRQIAHGESTVGTPKVLSMQQRLQDINQCCHVNTYQAALDDDNVDALIADYDVVVDCTDNFATRYRINDVCAQHKVPMVFGAIDQFTGQASVFNVHGGPCYRCVFPSPPPAELAPNCAAGGVFGVLPGFIGVIQATEVIKLLLSLGDTLNGRLLRFNALDMRMSELAFEQNADCPACSQRRFQARPELPVAACVLLPESVPEHWRISVSELKAWLVTAELDASSTAAPLLIDVREAGELEICRMDGADHVPLGLVQRGEHSLPMDKDVVLVCKSGVRSDKAVRALREAGYERVRSLSGGVMGWASQVAPQLPRY